MASASHSALQIAPSGARHDDAFAAYVWPKTRLKNTLAQLAAARAPRHVRMALREATPQRPTTAQAANAVAAPAEPGIATSAGASTDIISAAPRLPAHAPLVSRPGREREPGAGGVELAGAGAESHSDLAGRCRTDGPPSLDK